MLYDFKDVNPLLAKAPVQSWWRGRQQQRGIFIANLSSMEIICLIGRWRGRQQQRQNSV
jgi:hypothetical protein